MNQSVSLNLKNKFRMSNFTNFSSSPFEMFFNDWQSKISTETVFPPYKPEYNDFKNLPEVNENVVDLDAPVKENPIDVKSNTPSEMFKSNPSKKLHKISEKLKTKSQKPIFNPKEKYKIKTNLVEDKFNINNKPLRLCRCTYKDMNQDKSAEKKPKKPTSNIEDTKQGDFPKIGKSCNIHVKLAYYIFRQQQNAINVQNQMKKRVPNTLGQYPPQDHLYKPHHFSITNPMSFTPQRRPDLNLVNRYSHLVDPYFIMNYPKQTQKTQFGGYNSNIYNDNSLFRAPLMKPIKFPFEIDPIEAEKLMNNFGSQIPHKQPISMINMVNNKTKKSETLPDYRIDTVMKTQYRSRVV